MLHTVSFFIIIILHSCPGSLLFGDIIVQGTITDSQTHLPADSASVQFDVGSDTSRFTTNSNGQYSGTVTDLPNNKVIIPNEFSVEQNFPNPFNPSTTIEIGNAYDILEIYDILGRSKALINLDGREQTYRITQQVAKDIYI